MRLFGAHHPQNRPFLQVMRLFSAHHLHFACRLYLYLQEKQAVNMKRYYSLFLFFFVFIASSCIRLGNQGTPKGYVRYCVRLLDRQALYSDSPQWRQTKDSILLVSKNISSFDEAHSLVSRAAHIAGGKHSQLLPPVKYGERHCLCPSAGP